MLDPTFPIPKLDQLPRKIDPCPIFDTILEIRFRTTLSWSMLPGVIMLALGDKYPQQKELAANELPEVIRKQDAQLRIKGHIDFLPPDKSHIVRLGPQVISVHFTTYPGWDAIATIMGEIIGALSKSTSFKPEVDRLGLRYMDFFEEDMLSFLRLAVTVDEQKISPHSLNVNMEIKRDSMLALVQLHNKATLNRGDTLSGEGSVMDIDVSTGKPKLSILKDCLAWFDKAHRLQKEIFFGLIKPEKVEKLNPQF